MLSKSQIKYYSSLKQKKFRDRYGYFLAEGEKISTEFLKNGSNFLKIKSIIALGEFLNKIELPDGIKVIEADKDELGKISSLENPNLAILELEIPKQEINYPELRAQFSLFLEEIADPGNLGTIIRTADWFGIKDIFCSEGSVDPFNPKVIQASMGSFARVRVISINFIEFMKGLGSLPYPLPKIATVLDGKSIYQTRLPGEGIVFFGNESRGLSEGIIRESDLKVSIPPDNGSGAESLNVGVAVGVFCSVIKRG